MDGQTGCRYGAHPGAGRRRVVLHDIDADALTLLTRVCEKIMQGTGAQIQVKSTLDRREALHGACFVILCVAIGGLDAMRNDLEIPLNYGIHQAVGDTVGSGGLARALRHIPFAVQVAHEMESLCPAACMRNLTNPVTTMALAPLAGHIALPERVAENRKVMGLGIERERIEGVAAII